MGKVVFHNSISLDGFVAGPNDNPDNPLGNGGEAIFAWYFNGDTEVEVPGAPPMKMSKKSAEVFQQGISNIDLVGEFTHCALIAGIWKIPVG